MPEELIVQHCAPTLAGIKAGSLFTCPCESEPSMCEDIRSLNKRLVPKGIRVLPLRYWDDRVLLYVFRPTSLERALSDEMASEILKRSGYQCSSCNNCIVNLVKKMKTCDEFPHEIGLFLGYPPEDVSGFMENKACGYKCVGCWKVYGDEKAARQTFARFKKCTEVYCSLWEKGRDIEGLTVAS